MLEAATAIWPRLCGYTSSSRLPLPIAVAIKTAVGISFDYAAALELKTLHPTHRATFFGEVVDAPNSLTSRRASSKVMVPSSFSNSTIASAVGLPAAGVSLRLKYSCGCFHVCPCFATLHFYFVVV